MNDDDIQFLKEDYNKMMDDFQDFIYHWNEKLSAPILIFCLAQELSALAFELSPNHEEAKLLLERAFEGGIKIARCRKEETHCD